ncbi:MAG: globin domain-containing protein [Planctomycetota bacterium]|jgi:hemoglobin-like flavoprotein
MTEATLNLLRTSFNLLAPRGEELMERFFDKLFGERPELRPLFPEDLTELRSHLLASIVLVMENISDPGSLKAPLQQLGARHEAYGAVGEHYPIFRNTLIATMNEMAGAAWTTGHTDAWTAMLNLVGEVMLSGYAGEERRLAA